jgi:Spy/CpxP family protein refolding chaperone
MKNTLMRFGTVAALASGMIFAQTSAPSTQQPQPPAQHRQWNRSQMLDKLATKLNLTDDQKQQAKSIMDSSHESSKPVRDQLRQDRLALKDAVKAGKSEAEIDQLSANLGKDTGQMTAIRTKAFAKVYALLTPDQRTQADQLAGHAHGMFMGGHGHGQGGGAGR